MGEAPLILTAQLPADLQGWATALRTAHFPPERNYLAAHVTLFHALPGFCEGEVVQHVRQLANEFAPVDARILGIMSLGGGTAIRLESEGMQRLRALLAEHFHGLLTPQDQGGKRLHITVQNKVSKREAQALQAELSTQLGERPFAFRGLAVHRYRGGPWELAEEVAFRGRERA
ncbi:2'-5' RNA ligase family protein [Citromicrobium bathyomarinum]|uniref:2'-5' RNA ligase family protein n=1 Tax=Citromicrobium bathyomarinum TaxID=72174 RepID=UPI00315A9409